tara:strand:+ start:524 stop:1003 length:480 start_codon:yes stop_codon:yes gene_type:complete
MGDTQSTEECEDFNPDKLKKKTSQISDRMKNRSTIIIALIVFCILYKIIYLIKNWVAFIGNYFTIIQLIFVVICLGLYYGFIINNAVCWLKFSSIIKYINCAKYDKKVCFDSEKIDCLISKDGDEDLLKGSQFPVWVLPILSSVCFTLILLFTFAINTT